MVLWWNVLSNGFCCNLPQGNHVVWLSPATCREEAIITVVTCHHTQTDTQTHTHRDKVTSSCTLLCVAKKHASLSGPSFNYKATLTNDNLHP